MDRLSRGAILGAVILSSPALAVEPAPARPASIAAAPDINALMALKAQLDLERRELEAQRQALEAQRIRIQGLEDRLLDRLRAAGLGSGLAPATEQGAGPQLAAATPSEPSRREVETVGPKPAEQERVQDIAVLADQGGILTRAGRVTIEPTIEYARADRNRFVFRGIEVPRSVLIGVFDINESRQDILTASLAARFGLTSRFEIGGRVPFVYRSDTAVLVPLTQDPETPEPNRTINTSAKGHGIGDIEVNARYQLTDGLNGWPYLIGGIQVVAPTGKNPFEVPRDSLGNATKAATGAGFWGVAPSLTMLLPSDPATLFASLGYTYNFGRKVHTRVNDAIIDKVVPGGSPSLTMGIGIALNPRTSLSFAYAHNWQFATKTRIRQVDAATGATGDPITTKSRDLQLGRFQMGVSYRVNPKTIINWAVEMGATDDATDLRTTLRVPFTLN